MCHVCSWSSERPPTRYCCWPPSVGILRSQPSNPGNVGQTRQPWHRHTARVSREGADAQLAVSRLTDTRMPSPRWRVTNYVRTCSGVSRHWVVVGPSHGQGEQTGEPGGGREGGDSALHPVNPPLSPTLMSAASLTRERTG